MAGIALRIVRRRHISQSLILSDQGSLVEVEHLSTSYGVIMTSSYGVRLAIALLWLAPTSVSLTA